MPSRGFLASVTYLISFLVMTWGTFAFIIPESVWKLPAIITLIVYASVCYALIRVAEKIKDIFKTE
jgi:hypothetical protein